MNFAVLNNAEAFFPPPGGQKSHISPSGLKSGCHRASSFGRLFAFAWLQIVASIPWLVTPSSVFEVYQSSLCLHVTLTCPLMPTAPACLVDLVIALGPPRSFRIISPSQNLASYQQSLFGLLMSHALGIFRGLFFGLTHCSSLVSLYLVFSLPGAPFPATFTRLIPIHPPEPSPCVFSVRRLPPSPALLTR